MNNFAVYQVGCSNISVIEIEDVVSHIDGRSESLIDSKMILKTGYLQRVGMVQDTAHYTHVRGVCILVSHPGEESCEINLKIRKPFSGTVGYGHCEPVANASML